MTSTIQRRAARSNGPASRDAAAAPTAIPGGSVRRRWGRVTIGVGAAIVGAWIFAALYLSAGNRAEVVVMARDVARFDTIERSDLRVVRMSRDGDVETIPSSQLDSLVGRAAGVDLVGGSLLADGQVLSAGQALLAADEAVVGLLVGPGEGPSDSLRRGARVLVVVRPAQGASGEPVEFDGWVFDASAEELNTRERPLEVVVPKADAGAISAAAADRRVSVVVLSG